MAFEQLYAQLAAARRTTASLDWLLRRQQNYRYADGLSDKTSSGVLGDLANDRPPRLLYGTIVDTLAYPSWYKVQSSHLGTTLPCRLGTDGACGRLGARSLHQPVVGEQVLFAWHPLLFFGDILVCLPPVSRDGRKNLTDYISQQSRCGQQVEAAHQAPFRLPGQGDVSDWSAGRPADALSAGERGWTSETGLTIFLDQFMTFLRVSDDCGLWCFLHDGLTRLAGRNLQVRSSAMVSEHLNDRGELLVETGYASYFWEALGALTPTPSAGLSRTFTAKEAQLEKPHYSVLEPRYDDQTAFHRVRHYQGYGHGGQRVVVLPPPSSTQDLYRQSDRVPLAAVLREHIGLEGSYSLHSARGITLAKRVSLPASKRLRRPESPVPGEEYRFAGHYGPGPNHRLREALPTRPDEASAQRAAASLDELTRSANFKALHPMVQRAAVYLTPEEREVPYFSRVQEPIDFSVLQTQNYLPVPEAIPVTVDHVSGAVTYHANQSVFTLLPDGSVLIRDGFGAEIKTGQGDLELSAPNNIRIKAGKTLLLEGGYDVAAKAHNALDLSTTKGSVRVRSADKLLVKGEGMLFDSRGDIEMKAADDSFLVWADEVYLRAGVDDANGDPRPGRGLFLDAGKGLGVITTYSQTFERMLATAAYDYFGLAGSYTRGNAFTGQGSILSGDLNVAGCGIFRDDVLSGGWLTAAEHIGTGRGHEFGGQVVALRTDSLAKVTAAAAATDDYVEAVADGGNDTYANQFVLCLYDDDRSGNDPRIDATVFVFRSSAACLAADLVLYETYWQQLARLGGSGLAHWKEKDEQGTYPYPGRERSIEATAFRTVDPEVFDVAAGVSKERDDPGYLAADLAEPVDRILDEAYLVIDPGGEP